MHGWLDFIYFFLFFIVGYILYSDDRFLSAVRRDRWLLFAGGIVGLVGYFALTAVYAVTPSSNGPRQSSIPGPSFSSLPSHS